MKRSTQVSLVLMTAAGIGAGAYALAPNDSCRQPLPSTTARDPQGADPLASAPDCRSSRGGSSGRSSFFSSGSNSSGSSGATASAANGPSASTSASRGGFGSIGHALASFAGG